MTTACCGHVQTRARPPNEKVCSRPTVDYTGYSFRTIPPSIVFNWDPAVLLQELSWPSVAAVDNNLPVVIPIAAIEQHGRHLPVFTDSMLLGEVAGRARGLLGERVVWTPLLWLGNSHHHMDFAGTLSAAPRTYLDLLADLIDNLVNHGFERIVLLNGHGGNIVPAGQAIFEARQRYRARNDLLLLSATYWLLGAKPKEHDPSVVQEQMGHACEWETSMMLHLAPGLVGDLSQVEAVSPRMPFEPASQGWLTKERSTSGHIGDPRQATAGKGETLFRLFAQDVVNFLERVIRSKGCAWDG
jgi:creatinine amidohydrolase